MKHIFLTFNLIFTDVLTSLPSDVVVSELKSESE